MDACLNNENWLCQLTYLVDISHNLVKSAVLNSDESSFTAQKGILIKMTVSKYYNEKDCFTKFIKRDYFNFPNLYLVLLYQTRCFMIDILGRLHLHMNFRIGVSIL